MAEVMKSTKSRPVIPRLPEGHEDWGLQSTVVEKPVVVEPAPVPADVALLTEIRDLLRNKA
jgi:hypothetical protein